jgi:putative oxidoreductase
MERIFGPGQPASERQDWGIAVLRAAVGLVFMLHGWQKLFELGLPGVAGFFGQLGLPAPLMVATLVALLEFAGGAALLAGLFTRWLAIPLALDALAALLLVHRPNGFFVQNGGYELVLLLLAGSVALALAGPGAVALDRIIQPRARRMLVSMGAAR